MSAPGATHNPALGLALSFASMLGLRDQPVADGAPPAPPPSTSAPAAPAAPSSNPFFCYYASLVHQQNMLQDLVRTGVYQSAILQNAEDFRGKVVVDVGTGSGVLAFFAARAGARHVYALEASGVASRARTLLEANGLGDRITVLQCRVEEAVLPEQADIIISEPMGFMLIHERMLESFICARQRFLKPSGGGGGARMYPSRGTIQVCPFTDGALHAEQLAKVAFWGSTDFFGMDLTSLADAAAEDHFAQPVVGYIDPSALLSEGCGRHVIDFEGDAPEALQNIVVPFSCVATRAALCHGVAAWFDVDFLGPTAHVTLSTSPKCPGTHWCVGQVFVCVFSSFSFLSLSLSFFISPLYSMARYQCRVLLRHPIAVNAGQTLEGTLVCVANSRFSYDMTLKIALKGSAATTADGAEVSSAQACSLADQMYTFAGQQHAPETASAQPAAASGGGS